MNDKQCSICRLNKPLSEYYGQNKYSKKKGSYTYYPPYCKECATNKAKKWNNENYEEHRKQWTKYSKTQKWKNFREKTKDYQKQYQSNWRKDNKEKVREYRIIRDAHKKHDISKEEWESCKEFFSNGCAYCGISEEEAKKTQGQSLHKEHVVNDGLNDLSNCVPACKSCNSSKRDYKIEDWYNRANVNFTDERNKKIIIWLNEDHKLFISS